MGNACCSEGGQAADKEILNYSSKPRNHEQFARNNTPDLLLAYMSGDQRRLVPAENRGLDTKQRIRDGDQLVHDNLKAF
jgi:hypothetical protein